MHPSENVLKCIASFIETAENVFEHEHATSHPIFLHTLENILSASTTLNFIIYPLHGADVKRKIVYFSARLFLKILLRGKKQKY